MLNVVTNFLNTNTCKVIAVDHERRSVVQSEMLVSLVDPKGKSRTGYQSSDNLKAICCVFTSGICSWHVGRFTRFVNPVAT